MGRVRTPCMNSLQNLSGKYPRVHSVTTQFLMVIPVILDKKKKHRRGRKKFLNDPFSLKKVFSA